MATSTNFWDTTVGKTAKAALYLAISALIGYAISEVANRPELFGILTPAVNVILVAAKNYFDTGTPNLPTGAR